MSHDKTGRKMSSEEAKADIDAFAEKMFEEHVRAPRGSWTKSAYNVGHRLPPDERLLDEGIIEAHDAWFCVYVLTRDGKDVRIGLELTRHHNHDHPRGSVKFADVWLKDRTDKKAFDAFVEAVNKSIAAKYARR